MQVDQDDEGNFIESDEKKFFKIKPEMLHFEGDVVVDSSSILVQSEELEKADTLRMVNILVPLLQQSDPKVVGRSVKQLLVAFNKDPKQWLPDEWLQTIDSQGKIGSGQAPARQPGQPGQDQGQAGQNGELDTVVPEQEVEGGGS